MRGSFAASTPTRQSHLLQKNVQDLAVSDHRRHARSFVTVCVCSPKLTADTKAEFKRVSTAGLFGHKKKDGNKRSLMSKIDMITCSCTPNFEKRTNCPFKSRYKPSVCIFRVGVCGRIISKLEFRVTVYVCFEE